MSNCLLFQSFTYLLVYLFTCLLVYLFTCLLVYLFTCLLVCLLVYLFTCSLVYLFTCLPVYLFACSLVYLLTCLPVYLFTQCPLGTVAAIDGDRTTDITDITYTVTGIPAEFDFEIIAAAVQIMTSNSFGASTQVSLFEYTPNFITS